jgi:hypothetical protein
MAYRPHGGTVVPRHTAASKPRAGGATANDVVAQRHVTPAEQAQARLFEAMLRTEIVELLNLPPEGQAEMRSRIEELDRLIKALRHRFPQPPNPLVHELRPTADRAPRALLN